MGPWNQCVPNGRGASSPSQVSSGWKRSGHWSWSLTWHAPSQEDTVSREGEPNRFYDSNMAGNSYPIRTPLADLVFSPGQPRKQHLYPSANSNPTITKTISSTSIDEAPSKGQAQCSLFMTVNPPRADLKDTVTVPITQRRKLILRKHKQFLQGLWRADRYIK
jgi:hypothetical protein